MRLDGRLREIQFDSAGSVWSPGEKVKYKKRGDHAWHGWARMKERMLPVGTTRAMVGDLNSSRKNTSGYGG
jgi:hypothetical protein